MLTSDPTPSDHPVDALKKVVNQLRSPGGCPWDIEQTPISIAPHIIEEAYELVDAIQSGDPANIQDELSDQLLHVVMIADMIHENGGFNFDDVANHCCQKMIDRHPHVFGGAPLNTSQEVDAHWESQKSQKKSLAQVIDLVPKHLPALIRAKKVQKKAAGFGFDWPTLADAMKKLPEECNELMDATTISEKKHEIGDMLFTIVNLCRKLDIDAEELLQSATQRFVNRLKECDKIANAHGHTLSDCNPADLDMFWDQAKKTLL